MKNFFLRPLSIVAILMLSISINAQITTPQPSPSGSFTQSVGLTEIKVEYSRPAAKGRKIFGGVVPFDAVWRLGANSPTKFTTTDSITVAGKGLAKGTYVLMAKPGASEWEIIFNKNPTASAFGFKEEDNVVKVKVPTQNLPFNVESFSMMIGDITGTGASLDIMWENTLVRVPFTNDVDSKVMAQIKQKLAGPTQNDYYAMSTYYFETGKDLKQALEFCDKALNPNETRFWMLRHKSLIQAKMGDKKGAIATAQKSLEAAKEAKNNDYIRMNEASIKEWSK
ncbi:MAG: DUF2911 domain-containing protein [Saprospiraceae bacterium]|nr:DUF2911 domain-containing protein [Saprospiraceae bacterium]